MDSNSNEINVLIKMSGIRKKYGQIEVLHGVDLEVKKAEVHALIGENGAGKSTMMKILMGEVKMDQGTISVDGDIVKISSPNDAHTLGLRMIHQEILLVPDMTVAENIFSGVELKKWVFVKKKEQEKKAFSLPWARRCATAAVSYLQRRGISSDVIRRCFREGLFYEARYHGEPVCVFVGKDDAGKAKFACMRSIIGSLKKDVYGSDKEYSFCYPPHNPGSRHVAVFEAPIDALSHATLQELEGWKWDGYRLSLGGTSHVALAAFLERHPEIRRVNLYMDNDLGGLKNARKIKAMLHENPRFKHIRVGINPPRSGKDYNEKLLNVREQSKERQRQCRQKQAAISI